MLAKALRVKTKQHPGSSERWARPAFTFFFLLTFLLQSYATQTHIHLLPVVPGSSVSAVIGDTTERAKVSGSQQRENEKAPLKDSSDTCPLCQQILIAGAFVSPAFLALPVPTVSAVASPIAASLSAISRTASHSWHGRAPPSV